MTRRRPRPKPTPPRVIVTEPGFNTEALRLPANSDIKAEKASRRHVERAQRLDVFAKMYQQRTLAAGNTDENERRYVAVRRLEEDMHVAAGAGGCGEVRDFVSSSGSADAVNQRMIDAARRVELVLNLLRPWERRVLRELLEPETGGAALTRWHGIVQRITGATNVSRQAERVSMVAEALSWGFQVLDNAPRAVVGTR